MTPRFDPALAEFAEMVTAHTGIDLRNARRTEMMTLLAGHLTEGAPPEGQAVPRGFDPSRPSSADLVSQLTVGETYFYRDPEQLGAIREIVLPELDRRIANGQPVRVWSAGCATGEEPYTLAMIMADRGMDKISIEGTDLSRRRLEVARRAVYSPWVLRNAPPEWNRVYFERESHGFRVREELWRRVHFRYLNLARPSSDDEVGFPVAVDLILCRNVLIYLTKAAVALVCERLVHALRPGGWLVLGAADPPLLGKFPQEELEVLTTGGGLIYRRALSTPTRATRIGLTEEAAGPSGTRTGAQARLSSPSGAESSQPGGEPSRRPPPAGSEEAESTETEGGAGEAGGVAVAIRRVRKLADEGRTTHALVACEAALAEHTDIPELLHLLALLNLDQGNPEEAAEAARKAIYMAPDFALAHVCLARAFLALGDQSAARRALVRVHRLLERTADDATLRADEEMDVSSLMSRVAVQISMLREGRR